MKKILALALFLMAGTAATAQMRIPAPSPASSVSQVVGVSKVTIDYSAPAMAGRNVWVDLVPYGKVWRAGANSPTKITLADDATVMGQTLKAGTYSVFITPQKNSEWAVYFDASGKSVFDYDEDEAKVAATEGIVAIKVTPESTKDSQDRLSFHVTANADNKTGVVTMRWEKVALSFTLTFDTNKLTQASIEGQLGNWYTYANAAKFYAENDLDLAKAASWAEASIKLQDHFYNKWAMALVMSKKGDKAKALEFAKAAKEFGEKNPSGFYNAYKAAIEKAVSDWK